MVRKDAWPEEAVETLKAMWTKGASGSAIGLAVGMTRCAVLGKVHRLGLVRHGHAKPKALSSAARATRPYKRTCKPPVVLKEPKHVAPNIKPGEGLPLERLSSRVCRYPVFSHGSRHEFCGHPPRAGSTYCGYHHHVCHMPLVKKNRHAQ